MRKVPPARRFMQYIETSATEFEGTPCIDWIGSGEALYGTIWVRDESWTAHDYAYELAIGIPAGCEIHHRCGNKRCVNVLHLEAMTRADHKAEHKMTMCRKGLHPMTEPEHYYVNSDGTRRCVECTKARERQSYRNGGKEKKRAQRSRR